jgi:hypothetical protein
MICAKNGRAACCAEHSFADGPEYVHFMENLFGYLFNLTKLTFYEFRTDTHFMRYPTRRGEKLKDYISHLKPAQRLHIDLVDGVSFTYITINLFRWNLKSSAVSTNTLLRL